MMKNLKDQWKFPKMPKGFNQAIITLGVSGNVEIEFALIKNKELKKIENPKEKIEWPWIKGYEPTEEDWRSLGFNVSHAFDSCFGTPVMFKHWKNKEDK